MLNQDKRNFRDLCLKPTKSNSCKQMKQKMFLRLRCGKTIEKKKTQV